MTLTCEEGEEFAAVGFLCSLIVVAIHCSGLANVWLSGTDGGVSILAAILQFVGTETVARCAVPWFFLVSGFFLVKHVGEETLESWWRHTVARRILTLGVPYLCWNLVYYLFRLALGNYGFKPVHALHLLTGWDFGELACGQFWYVRTILLYAFVSPVFVAMLRPHRFGGIFLVALAAAWLGGISTGVAFQPLNWGYLLFFGTGVYMGLHGLWTVHERSARIALMALFFIAAGGVVVSLLLRVPTVFALFQRTMILFGVVALWLNRTVVRVVLLPFRRWWGLAFFIYAVHILFTSLAYQAMVRVLPPMAYETVGYVVKIAVGIGGSLAVGMALHRLTPRLLSVLCGGRTA